MPLLHSALLQKTPRPPARCRFWLLACLSISLAHGLSLRAETRTISVGVLTDNHPFSSLSSSGAPEGFAVDLLASIEYSMGLSLTRIKGTTDEINPAFIAGRIDMVQTFAQSPERESFALFTTPYAIMGGSIFVNQKTKNVRTLQDLRGLKVMVHPGSLGEKVLQQHGLAASIVYVKSVEEALRHLESGQGDATLVTRLTGLAAAHRLGLTHIQPVGDPIPGYEVRYCFAVRKQDTELLFRINEGLQLLHTTKEYDKIYRKWFQGIDPALGYTTQDITLAIAVGLGLALAIAIASVRRQRTLTTRIAQQADLLRTSEERHRSVFMASSAGLLVVEPEPSRPDELILRESNPAARLLFKLNPAHSGSLRLRDLFPQDLALTQRIQSCPTGDFEHLLSQQDTALHLRFSVSRLGTGLLIAASDITAEKATAAKLQQQETHLRQTQKLEAIGTLASGVAHDFNNILTGILGHAELAQMDLPPEHPASESIREVLASAQRAKKLVRQILTFSRNAEARREIIQPSTLITETISLLRATLPDSITLTHQPAPIPTEIEADPTQLHQVLLNLCTNAIHAMRDLPGVLEIIEDSVTITADDTTQHARLPAGRYVRISIRDTGTGMTPEVLQHLFEPFFTTKPSGEGTGLGLSVVHGIMQTHRGAITVYSKPGQGTIFHLYFPAANKAAEKPLLAPPTFHQGHGEELILIDDEPAITLAASRLLEKQGYTVRAFNDPALALAELERSPTRYALVMSDLTMPKLNGLDLAERLQNRFPFVLISGFVSEPDRARARALKISQIVDKPITIAALSQAVSEALASR